MFGFLPVFFFFSGTLLIPGLALNFTITCDSVHVVKMEKEDAILSCRLVPPEDLTNETIKWSLNWTLGDRTVHTWRSGQDDLNDQHEQFQDRTQLSEEELRKGNITLTITNISTEDTGQYKCLVTVHHHGRFHTPKDIGIITLQVNIEGPEDRIIRDLTTVKPTPDSPKGSSMTTAGAVVIGLCLAASIFAGYFLIKKWKSCTEGAGSRGPVQSIVEDRANPPSAAPREAYRMVSRVGTGAGLDDPENPDSPRDEGPADPEQVPLNDFNREEVDPV